MIEFYSETDFTIENKEVVAQWIVSVIEAEGHSLGEISYVFCDDTFLHKINLEYLNHDTYTDIISFDYSVGKQVNGEIYISVERVKDNAAQYGETFQNELLRVIIHGVLHFMGYTDKTKEEEQLMRKKENDCITLFKG